MNYINNSDMASVMQLISYLNGLPVYTGHPSLDVEVVAEIRDREGDLMDRVEPVNNIYMFLPVGDE